MLRYNFTQLRGISKAVVLNLFKLADQRKKNCPVTEQEEGREGIKTQLRYIIYG